MAELSSAARQDAAEQGHAMPDGSYPIRPRKELAKAVMAFGRASNKPAVKRHIKRRAKALNATHLLPDSWQT